MVEILDDAEYELLEEVADGYKPDPKHSITLVIRKDGKVIGRLFLLTPIHIEGIWVEGKERGKTAVKRLMDEAENVVKSCGCTKLFAYAVTEENEGYLARLGYSKLPWTVWVKEV